MLRLPTSKKAMPICVVSPAGYLFCYYSFNIVCNKYYKLILLYYNNYKAKEEQIVFIYITKTLTTLKFQIMPALFNK